MAGGELHPVAATLDSILDAGQQQYAIPAVYPELLEQERHCGLGRGVLWGDGSLGFAQLPDGDLWVRCFEPIDYLGGWVLSESVVGRGL